jgi:hydrogenase expression/formation protein HypC
MCLALPARVVALTGTDTAKIDLAGVQKEISTALLDHVAPGDYVIVHVGYALTRLDPDEAERTLAEFASAGLVPAALDAPPAAPATPAAN